MKRSSTPNISAPLSRRKKASSPINPICAAATIFVLILFSLGGALLFFARRSNNTNHNNESHEASSQLLRRQQKQSEVNIISKEEQKRDPTNTNGLLIRTKEIGDIRIKFRPDLSGPSSIQYIIDVVEAATAALKTDGNTNDDGVVCTRCKFYRAEKKLLLQGVIAQNSIPSSAVVLGPCPEAAPPELHCPEHDPNCACHGPIMTKGMVGWAGGGEGPDFFINTFDKPVDWWENQHTVWGELDEESIRVVESAYEFPVSEQGGMKMLDKKIAFSLALF